MSDYKTEQVSIDDASKGSVLVGNEFLTNDDLKTICDNAASYADQQGGNVFDKGNSFVAYLNDHTDCEAFSVVVIDPGNALYGRYGDNVYQYYHCLNNVVYQATFFNYA